MKLRTIISLVLIASVAAGAYFANLALQTRWGTQALADTGLDFLALDQALDLAKKQNRPVLVDFSAVWCPNCRALHEVVFANAAVKQAIQAQFIVARVDYESPEAPAFMARYAIHGFPSLLLLNPDGSAIRRLPVDLDPQKFLAAINH